ncbi:MAG: rRNA pseudouridine synthase, partial [Lachnospiraceae bacterium]|nr:rRNA pseudouridine synthase [Lachnospiraceae bacterium]
MRLDRLLCELNLGTRSQVKKEIKAGLVSVNGVTVLRPEEQVREAADLVCYKGQPCVYEEYVYYLLHKPAGVVSATQDKRDRTVLDLLAGEGRSDLFPVGRLDKDTEGLLLITNDGPLAHALLSPGRHVDKEYECHLAHTFDAHQRELLEQGVDIGEKKKCRPAVVRILAEKKITLTITEGRFHQVKRMLHAVGNEVVYLKRIRMDRLQLEDSLEKGAYRRLTDEEV